MANKQGKKGKKQGNETGGDNPGPNGKAVEAEAKTQACPVCGEFMDIDAIRCEACGHDLKGVSPKKNEAAGQKPKGAKEGKPTKKGGVVNGVENATKAEGKKEKPGAPKKGTITGGQKPKRSPQDSEDQALAKWLSGEAGENALQVWLGKTPETPAPAAAKAQAGAPESKDFALKMWLTGEAGGDALDEWLSEEKALPEVAAGELDEQIAQKDAVIKEKEEELEARAKEIKDLKTELEAFKKSLRDKLSKLKTKDFDPLKLITETAELNKTLQGEIKRRKELEQEIEKVKKGSIAVIKYVKAQQMKIREKEMKKLKTQLKKTTEDEERLKKIIEEKEKRFAELEKSLESKIEDLPAEMKKLKQKEMELIKKESDISTKEQQLVSHAKELQEKEALVSTAGSASDEELRNRFESELQEKETDYLKRESELKKRIIALEEEVSKAKIDEKLEKEALERRGKSEGEISKDLIEKEKLLASKEKSIILRENEIERLKEELRFKTDEIKKLKEPLAYKEDELLRREEDMLYREKLLMAEKRKLEEAKKEGGGLQEMEFKKRLEELQQKISEKEAEIIKKEKYLHAKSEELRVREQGLIEEEIEAREEERALELQVEKVKTGNPRLDDLLFGGIPFGVNVLVYGAAFIGKEVIVSQFIAEGLKKGIPAVWVLTDKSPSDIREEMEFVVSGYQEYERLDLVRYVDAYSKSMGGDTEEAHTIYIDQPTNHEAILKAVEGVAKEFLNKHKYYRLAFRSISTLIAYLDMNIAYRFLQPFAGRRKRDKAVSMYVLEKGMHSDTDIKMVGSIMDGEMELKSEQLQTFICVKGIGDVQSRAWIRYTHSKKGVSIGSFALGHIR